MDQDRGRKRWLDERLALLGLPAAQEPERPRTAVVGVDGGQPGRHAAAWAGLLAQEVHLVAALGRPRTLGGTAAAAQPGADDLWLLTTKEAEQALAEGREALTDTSAKVSEVIADPQPARAILEMAEANDAELIAVGSHGKPFVERALLGSVSEALAHHAPRSLLVAKQDPGPGPIIACVGKDPGSVAVAGWGSALARWLDRSLIVAHAAPDYAVPEGFANDRERAHASIVGWPPRRTVPKLARNLEASLVVVGRGSRPGWLGSSAIGMLRHAPSSVLVVRSAEAST